MSNHPNCTTCGEPLIWGLVSATRKLMPLDPDKHPKGNVRFEADRIGVVVLSGAALKDAQRDGDELYQAHFVTCPQAAEHRRKQRAGAGS